MTYRIKIDVEVQMGHFFNHFDEVQSRKEYLWNYQVLEMIEWLSQHVCFTYNRRPPIVTKQWRIEEGFPHTHHIDGWGQTLGGNTGEHWLEVEDDVAVQLRILFPESVTVTHQVTEDQKNYFKKWPH